MGKKQRQNKRQQQHQQQQKKKANKKRQQLQTQQQQHDDEEEGETPPLLSPELAAALGEVEGGGGGDGVIVPSEPKDKTSKKRKLDARGNVVEEEVLQDARKLSKSARKRLDQIAARKAKEAKRADLYKTLEAQRLTEKEQSFLQSSKGFSQGKVTMKVRLARALERQRAGLPVEDEEAMEFLLRKRGGAEGEEMELPSSFFPTGVLPLPSPPAEVTAKEEKEHQQKEEGTRDGAAALKKQEARRAAKARRRQRKQEEEQERAEVARRAQGGESESGSEGEGDDSQGEDSRSSQGEEDGEEDEEQSYNMDAENDEEGEEGDDEEDEEVEEEEATITTRTTNPVQEEPSSSSLGSSLFAQLAKLSSSSQAKREEEEQQKQKPEGDQDEQERRRQAAASIKIPGLEGVDWLSVLEDLLKEGEGEEGEGGEEGQGGERKKKAKYIPKEIPLLSPAAALALREKMQGGKNKDGEREEKEASLPRRERQVQLNRTPDIQAARMQLPVCGMEQEIVEAVNEHDVVILCGETGSGKSTQVPQFLYEYGYTQMSSSSSSSSSPPSSSSSSSSSAAYLIGVTQPRRVAAVSTAQRVAVELNTNCGKGGHVAYQIRYDSRGVTEATHIKFMTDGILLQEISSDLLLRRYSVLLLDEAHERNLNTDVLLGLLSRALPLRNQIATEEQARFDALGEAEKAKAPVPLRPLKLVIMSATLRVEDFTANRRLFPAGPPPVLRVEARQHPVSIHFSRRTPLEHPSAYLEQAYKKVCKIHKKLPPGGILIFLTGKAEIMYMCQKLRKGLGPVKKKTKDKIERGRREGQQEDAEEREEEKEKTEGEESVKVWEMDDEEAEGDAVDPFEGKDDYDDPSSASSSSSSADESEEDDGEDEEKKAKEAKKPEEKEGEEEGGEEPPAPVHILPLYAMLPPKEQGKVFLPPPSPAHRLIIVSTNVAETSVTIPGIKYVVDCGRVKSRAYEHASGISRYEVQWISQASADQRAGRAGRTGPGHCYRLYSSAVFSQRLEKFSAPEVLSLPLEDVVLQMKALGIPAIERFPFPTPPEEKALLAASSLLSNLGVLSSSASSSSSLTPLGKRMATLPLGVRTSKMLLLGDKSMRYQGRGRGGGGGGTDGVELVIALVAGLTERDPFLFPDGRKAAKGKGEGDGESEEEDEEDEETRLLRQKTAALKMEKYRQWRHPTSDALARLRAVGAYTYAQSKGNGAEFCRENMLHGPTMSRTLDLRRQLGRTLNRRFEDDEVFIPVQLNAGMRPPTPGQETALRQLLLSGHLDQVARLAPVGTVASGSRLQRQCAYLGCTAAMTEPLYLHPHSSLFSPNPERLPEFVTYQMIVRSAKGLNYMTCATAIEPDWLPPLALHTPLLSFHPPLSSPAPAYDAVRDRIVFYCVPKYGARNWELRPFPLTGRDLLLSAGGGGASADKKKIKEENEALREKECRWFARLLLEGKIIPALAPLYQKATTAKRTTMHEDDEDEEEGRSLQKSKTDEEAGYLNDPPALITHRRPVRKVFEVLQPLLDANIASLAALRQQWEQDPAFLKLGVQMWVRPERVREFELLWEKVVCLCLNGKREKQGKEGGKKKRQN